MAAENREGRGEQRPAEQRSYALPFLLLTLATLLSTAWVFYDEVETRRPWKEVQRRFNSLRAARGEPALPLRIRQITNPGLGVVDRCQTCHLGINTPGLTGQAVPALFRSHPRRASLLGKGHRPDQVGCTPCHGGQGAQTKGVGQAPFDHGRNDPYWERPMLRGAYVESSCAHRCHQEERDIPGARRYNAGRRLFADRRCFGCHATRQGDPGYPGGPSLEYLRQKMSRAMVEQWLADPSAMRPHSRMPNFWPDAAARGQREAEVKAITAYLGSLRPASPLPEAAQLDRKPALVSEGERLFNKIGCRGCHTLDNSKGQGDAPAPLEERHGPSLARVGDMASASWLSAWLAAPHKLWPGGGVRMPDLRLSPAERGALVAFLITQGRTPNQPLSPRWPVAPADQIQRGEALVSKYMCAGCHALPGKKPEPPPGPTLVNWGDTPPDRLAWGNARSAVQCGGHNALECWTEEKLRHPRRFSSERLHLVMPDHQLSSRQARNLAVFLMSNRRRQAPSAWRRKRTEAMRVRQEAEAHLDRLNCRTCHEIGRVSLPEVDEDGELIGTWRHIPVGGQVRRHHASPAQAPPSLTFAGEKFQYPWLYSYLERPIRLRPWLTARMPTFNALDAGGRELIVRYLAQRNGHPYPFAPLDLEPVAARDRPDAAWLFGKMQCQKCHQISNMAGIKQADLAPNLALAQRRLQPDWVRGWLLDPQHQAPGTRMPNYFPLADDDDPTSHTTPFTERLGGSVQRQVDALVRLTMRFGVEAGLKVPVPDGAGSGNKGVR